MQVGEWHQEINLVVDHMLALSRLPFLRNTQFVFLPENSMGHSPGHVWNAVHQQVPNATTVYEKVDGFKQPHCDPGIVTTAKGKIDYANAARHHITRGTLAIYKDLVTVNRYLDKSSRQTTTWNKFCRQLRQYRLIVEESEKPTTRTRTTVSGVVDKYGKKNPSVNDDIMMMLTFAVRMCDVLMDRSMPNFDHRNVPN